LNIQKAENYFALYSKWALKIKLKSPKMPLNVRTQGFAVIYRKAEVQVYLLFSEQNLTFKNGT
jgi:hypothetical protein